MNSDSKEYTQIKSKPFLRWAGGKTWLIKHLSMFLPSEGFQNYHEPFLGGAAIFFHLQPRKSYLSDLNPELIETYIQVRDNVDKVIKELKKFENTEEFYYRVRQETFSNPIKNAAKFIYLNQTSFNGIYRVNLKGEYNVPYGYRDKPFFDTKSLRIVSERLSMATINNYDFSQSLKFIKKNDLVFLDPPYTVTHNNNGFIKYNKKLFDIESQYLLSEYIDEIKRRGAFYILTNAAHEVVEKIFNKDGDSMISINRASLIGGKNASRGNYAELIISNIVK